MRSMTQQESNVLSSPARSNHMRVQVKDSGGTWRDLSSLRSVDFVLSAQVQATVDDPVGRASVTLARESFKNSLAPLATDGALYAAYGVLLALGRELKIEAQSLPFGQPSSAVGTWRMVFHGYIDDVDWGPDAVQVNCRDLSAKLQDTWIESERLYGRWQASRAVRVGTVVKRSNDPTGTTTGAQAWRCTTAGTTGSSEPSWPASPSIGTTQSDGTVTWTYQAAATRATTTAYSLNAIVKGYTALQYWTCTTAGTSGSTATASLFPSAPTVGQTVTDGSVVWTYTAGLFGTPVETLMQSIIDDNLGAGVVTLATPSGSTGWYAGEFKQQMESVWSALQALATQLGYDLRFNYSDGASDFQLQLRAVSRSGASVDWTLGPNLVLDLRKVARSILGIRNAVSVVFSNSESWDTVLQAPARQTVTVTDSTSISAYGRRWMQVSEASSSGVNTLALATQFANAMLSDLKEPTVEMEVDIPVFWAVGINDYFEFTPHRLHFSTALDLAVVGYTHNWTRERQVTTLQVRGEPTAGQVRYSDIQAAPGLSPPNRILSPAATSSATATAKAEGVIINHAFPPVSWLPPGVTSAELHISTSSGFTPDNTTLAQVSTGTRFEVQGLVPGRTYYAKIAYRDSRGNLSAYSAQASFAAGAVNTSVVLKYTLSADGTYSNDTLLTFDTKVVDITSDWNGSDKFTASIAGYYRVMVLLNITGAASGDRCRIYLNKGTGGGSGSKYAVGAWTPACGDGSSNYELYPYLDELIYLAAGDWIQVYSLFAGGGGAKTLRAPDPTTSPYHPGCRIEIELVREG